MAGRARCPAVANKHINCSWITVTMWKVRYKHHNDAQAWLTLDTYDRKSQALIHAARVSGEYYMVIVIDPDGDQIWSNFAQASSG